MRTFYFEPLSCEFVEGQSDELSGNRVIVRWEADPEGPTYRFEVHLDEFGCAVAALNRLVRKFIPTFEPF